jgi:hypothetical protein
MTPRDILDRYQELSYGCTIEMEEFVPNGFDRFGRVLYHQGYSGPYSPEVEQEIIAKGHSYHCTLQPPPLPNPDDDQNSDDWRRCHHIWLIGIENEDYPWPESQCGPLYDDADGYTTLADRSKQLEEALNGNDLGEVEVALIALDYALRTLPNSHLEGPQ